MKFLIFGCGYLGKRVASAWIQAGHQVFAVTRSEQNAATFRALGIRPIIADICEPDSLNGLPQVDAVLNSVGFDRTSNRTHEEVTCGGLTNILAAMEGRCTRFLQISSSSVYGQSEGEWVDETSPCDPQTPGGQLCVRAEQMVRERFSLQTGGSAQILRLAGIYGPSRILSRIESLKAGLTLVGSPDSWLNLIHVDDAVTAILASEQQSHSNQAYLVVDNKPILRSTYYETLAELVHAPKPVFDSSQPSPRGSGGVNKRCSNRKLREVLGWNPVYPTITTGLPHAINQ